MKTLLFFLLLPFISLAGAAQPLSRQLLTQQQWTDGYEFVKYVANSEQEVMGIPNPAFGHHGRLFFVGGSLHEGGTNCCLEEKDGNFTIAQLGPDIYQWFPAGDRIEYIAGCLIIRDSANGMLHGVLQPLQAEEDLEDHIRQNLRTFGLAGKYQDEEGREYCFSDTCCRAEGFPHPQYEFGYVFETPVLVLIFNKDIYGVARCHKGLRLSPMKQGEYNYEPLSGGKVRFLQRIISNDEEEYPETARKLLTSAQIRLYTGAATIAYNTPREAEDRQAALTALATMRNEIFARHGHRFNSERWQRHFAQKTWYTPTSSDATPQLSEIERINIEQIRKVEKELQR